MFKLEGDNFFFTWFGPTGKKNKLDRVIVNEAWMKSNSWRVIGWHRRSSDHVPISLLGDRRDWGPKPFKTFDYWRKDKEVVDLLNKVIQENYGNNWFSIMKEVKINLKHWSCNRLSTSMSRIELGG